MLLKGIRSLFGSEDIRPPRTSTPVGDDSEESVRKAHQLTDAGEQTVTFNAYQHNSVLLEFVKKNFCEVFQKMQCVDFIPGCIQIIYCTLRHFNILPKTYKHVSETF